MTNVSNIPDAELVRRAIAEMQVPRGKGKGPLWACVGDRFLLGSTYAKQLCERFGFDPEQRARP